MLESSRRVHFYFCSYSQSHFMSSLANISIRFRADLKQFSSQMKNVDRRLKKVGKRLSSIGSSMSMNFTAPIVAGLALVTKGTEELRSDLGRLETNAMLAGEGIGFYA